MPDVWGVSSVGAPRRPQTKSGPRSATLTVARKIRLETDQDLKRLLLISNSTLYGSGYLDHAAAEILDFLGAVTRVLFVPFALANRDAYAEQARARFAALGFELDSLHVSTDKRDAVANAQAIFVGGGNTFRLLKSSLRFRFTVTDKGKGLARYALHWIERRF